MAAVNKVKTPPVWQGKKYKLVKSENFEEYMKALGIGLTLRKMGNSVSPIVQLEKDDDDNYTFTSCSQFKSSVNKFRLEKEFEQQTVDGREVKNIMTLSDNKLVQEQRGQKLTTIIREFSEKKLITTLKVGEITSIRTYEVCPPGY